MRESWDEPVLYLERGADYTTAHAHVKLVEGSRISSMDCTDAIDFLGLVLCSNDAGCYHWGKPGEGYTGPS